MANIAEGFVRKSDKEFVQFLFIAMSSAAEVQSHLYVALDLSYISDEQFRDDLLSSGQDSTNHISPNQILKDGPPIWRIDQRDETDQTD